MHTINSILMTAVITAWDYKLSFLELIAFITSVVGVALGIFGPRSTWPWWNLSSLLYAVLFFEQKYYASGAIQFVFIAGGFWGWYGWGPQGAKPERLTRNLKIRWSLGLVILWFALYPILLHIGAAASLTDAFGFAGSCVAQVIMIQQKYEAWPLWFIVDAVYTYQYWHGGLYLTAILYLIFVGLAVGGWARWLREAKKHELITS
jgi:nicotinamide mononucleotide transporter